MAVVIDGTTGVSLIQDGVVQTADLASTLDLSGKTVTYGLSSSDMPAGAIIQVIETTGNTVSSVSTTTNTRVGVEASITPKASNSKIIVLCNATCRWPHGDAGFTALHRKIGSGSWNEIKTFSRHTMYRNFDTTSINGQHISFNYVDSPATTDVVTYSWAMNRFVSGTAEFLPNYSSGDSQNWTLMEIAQ